MSNPTDPGARLRMAAQFTTEALVLRLCDFQKAHGTDPVLVVAVPDCEIGRRFIAGRFGPDAPRALVGAAVFAFSLDEFLACFGPDDQMPLRARVLELKAQPGDMRIAFMVNGSGIEFRLLPAPGSLPGRDTPVHVPN